MPVALRRIEKVRSSQIIGDGEKKKALIIQDVVTSYTKFSLNSRKVGGTQFIIIAGAEIVPYTVDFALLAYKFITPIRIDLKVMSV